MSFYFLYLNNSVLENFDVVACLVDTPSRALRSDLVDDDPADWQIQRRSAEQRDEHDEDSFCRFARVHEYEKAGGRSEFDAVGVVDEGVTSHFLFGWVVGKDSWEDRNVDEGEEDQEEEDVGRVTELER